MTFVSRPAFSLISVLVAIMLMAVGLAAFQSQMLFTARHIADSRKETEAASRAEWHHEALVNGPCVQSEIVDSGNNVKVVRSTKPRSGYDSAHSHIGLVDVDISTYYEGALVDRNERYVSVARCY